MDSKYTHYAWINTPREEGGLTGLKLPLLSDLTKQIAKDYGVLLEDEGISLRYSIYNSVSFKTLELVNFEGILRFSTSINFVDFSLPKVIHTPIT